MLISLLSAAAAPRLLDLPGTPLFFRLMFKLGVDLVGSGFKFKLGGEEGTRLKNPPTTSKIKIKVVKVILISSRNGSKVSVSISNITIRNNSSKLFLC